MSLTSAKAPFGSEPAGRFNHPMPGDTVWSEPHLRRVRARKGGQWVIDSQDVWMVHRPMRPTFYAFPADAVPESLSPREVAEVPGYVSVRWSDVDEWWEEDVHLVHNLYPKNPYHRVDCLASSRHLEVSIGDTVLVDTTDTVLVAETAMDPRLYVAKQHVRMDLLSPSDSPATWCSYKGLATYWNATIDGAVLADVAWSYEEPLGESQAIAGMLSFYESKVAVTAELPG